MSTIPFMYVCICLGVTDTEIASAIKEGHDTVNKINRELGAAGCCGSCMTTIESIIDLYKNQDNSSEPVFYPASS